MARRIHQYQGKPIEWKVDRNGCHICTSHRPSGVYPSVSRQSKRMTIARYLWANANGSIPRGLCIRHTCDNPMCINLKHLKIGTNADNQRDMVERERSARGETHPKARLTEQNVREIRAFGSGITQRMIGLIYSVSQTQISDIRRGRYWKHIS